MKVLLTTLKLTTLLVFGSIMLLTIGAYLNLPLPLKPLVVKTGSMEPAVPAGSLVLVTKKPLDGAGVNYVEGDIVTFKSGSELVSHRVVRVDRATGEKMFETKGDANEDPDSSLTAEKDVVGRVNLSVPYVGRFVDFVKQPLGFFLLIIIPTLLIIISELISIWEELKKKPQKSSNLDFAKPFAMFFMAAIFLGSSHAFFSDVETSTNNVFSAAEAFCDENPTLLASYIDEETTQGTLKNGSPITNPARTDPNAALIKDWVIGGSTGFYSLGFYTGVATYVFPYQILDVGPAILTFYEATNGRATYPLEQATVEVSQDGITYYNIGNVTSEPGVGGDGISELGFSGTGLSSIKFVRLTESTPFPNSHTSDADGFDIDAITAEFGNCDQ